MREYFAVGAGRSLFGDWQPLVVATSDTLMARAIAMARAAARSKEFPDAREFIQTWAADHPLEDLLFVRRSTTTRWMDTAAGTTGGGLGSVAEIEESMVDLLARMRSYAGELPKQARWQSQLAVLEVLEGQDLQQFFAAIDTVESDIGKIERRFDEFTIMVDAMYRDAWMHVAAQQAQATADANALLAVTLAAITAEREAVLLAIEESRTATMADLDALRGPMLAETSAALRGAIDHLVWRLAQLLAGFLVVAGLIGWLLIRYARR
jgi:hypothetical protein